jgi:outer membrane PBP1 activator LpoA protein
MFQNTHSTAAARGTIRPLLAVLTFALSGCAGIHMGSSYDLDPAVTGDYRSNQTLAVLLPMSGRFAGAAQVVRDGIVAAQEADPPGTRPTLRFYDSASGSVKALVRRAAADGASLVIGPLQKPAVDALASSKSLPIPVLALNLASTKRRSPANLYQFALSPEDEAAEVANKAWNAGHRRALMLSPEGSWGNRISRAFRAEWKALGGTMAGAETFDSRAYDFSGTVAALSNKAGGADFVFLVATPDPARQILPQIRHKIGPEMPVYSTSHVYGGRFDQQGDRGLVGLRFVEIPWLVEPARGDTVSSTGLHKKLPRLYAMGVDAYRLGSRLDWMLSNPQARLQGKTGVLRMDSQRRIHRDLTLVRIDATGPVKTAAVGGDEAGVLVSMESMSRLGPRLAGIGLSPVGGVRP